MGQLPRLLQGQLVVWKQRDREEKGNCFMSPEDRQPFAHSQHQPVAPFSLLSPQQCRVMAGGEGAAAGSILGASPRLCWAADVLFASGAESPVGNWLLWCVPALQGTELLLQGKGWQVAMDNGASSPGTSHPGTGATVLTPVLTQSVLPSNSCPGILLPGHQLGPVQAAPAPVQVLPAGLGKELLLASGLAHQALSHERMLLPQLQKQHPHLTHPWSCPWQGRSQLLPLAPSSLPEHHSPLKTFPLFPLNLQRCGSCSSEHGKGT